MTDEKEDICSNGSLVIHHTWLAVMDFRVPQVLRLRIGPRRFSASDWQ